MATLDDKIKSAIRGAVLGSALAISAAGCTQANSPGDYSFTMPEIANSDTLKVQDEGTRTAIFFRMDGTYLGTAKYTQDKDAKQSYSPNTLRQQGIRLDDKIDLYYAIREEPHLDEKSKALTPGKMITSPRKISDELIIIPQRKKGERQIIIYTMKEHVVENDAYSAVLIEKKTR